MLLLFSQLIIRNIDRLYQYLLQASSNLVDNITYGAAICSLIVTKYFIFSVALDINLNRTFKMFNIQIQICKITSFHYFWVKLSSVCLMFAYRKKFALGLRVTYTYPRVTYSDTKVTHSDPTHFPLPPPASPVNCQAIS